LTYEPVQKSSTCVSIRQLKHFYSRKHLTITVTCYDVFFYLSHWCRPYRGPRKLYTSE